jgi:hypothetical protein
MNSASGVPDSGGDLAFFWGCASIGPLHSGRLESADGFLAILSIEKP